jgi:hypothetical protein
VLAVVAGRALEVVADEVAAADEAVAAAAVDGAERSTHVDIIKRTGGT